MKQKIYIFLICERDDWTFGWEKKGGRTMYYGINRYYLKGQTVGGMRSGRMDVGG